MNNPVENIENNVVPENDQTVDTTPTEITTDPQVQPQTQPTEIRPTFYQALSMNWFTDEAEHAIATTIKEHNMENMPIKNLNDPVKIRRTTQMLGILGIDSFLLGSIWIGLGRLILTLSAVFLFISPLWNKLKATISGNSTVANQSMVPVLVLAVVIAAVSVCMWVISILTAYKRTRALNTLRFAQIADNRGAIVGGLKLGDIVEIGLLAALVFVTAYFLRIPIPTPIGETQLKVANIICLLAGILLGGIKGGLAAGIGSFLFDLTNPAYISSAPTTFINFFLMAYICGGITYANNKLLTVTKDKLSITYVEPTTTRIISASIIGAFSYFMLYATKTVINLMLLGSEFTVALVSAQPKLLVSLANTMIAATVVSLTGHTILNKWNKLHIRKARKK